LYGAKLQRAGHDVHFLVRSDYEHVRERGLTIESPQGDFHLPQVQAYRRVDEMPACDVVCIALKTTQNHRLPDLLPAVTKSDGVVLVLQNGLGVEDAVARIVGPQRVIGGMCFLCSNKVGPGHIKHLDYGAITIGEYRADGSAGGVTDRMRQLADDFERAGIPMRLAEDLLTARWKKLMWNVPYNGLTVVLDCTTADIMRDPESRTLAEELMHEIAAAAAASGRTISPGFIQKMLDDTAKMVPYRTSMKVDYDERRPMEVEAIFGAPLRAAEAAGARCPRLAMLYRLLKFLDERNTRHRNG
jgi:2-dehydropantoate 2-reductase